MDRRKVKREQIPLREFVDLFGVRPDTISSIFRRIWVYPANARTADVNAVRDEPFILLVVMYFLKADPTQTAGAFMTGLSRPVYVRSVNHGLNALSVVLDKACR
jgi:hypothetical protein